MRIAGINARTQRVIGFFIKDFRDNWSSTAGKENAKHAIINRR
jgi:hypothetical protein